MPASSSAAAMISPTVSFAVQYLLKLFMSPSRSMRANFLMRVEPCICAPSGATNGTPSSACIHSSSPPPGLTTIATSDAISSSSPTAFVGTTMLNGRGVRVAMPSPKGTEPSGSVMFSGGTCQSSLPSLVIAQCAARLLVSSPFASATSIVMSALSALTGLTLTRTLMAPPLTVLANSIARILRGCEFCAVLSCTEGCAVVVAACTTGE
mmetsp:Transcript_2485/g.6194  ORF Transcript_2485/g.6194 Transcript_2485/m.6194 type:complete len:209 (+) Transcript_2485:2829-3455(+)